MENFDFRRYRKNLADKILKGPDKQERRGMLNAIKGTQRYKLAEKIKKETRKDQVEKILNELGIERDLEGKIVLYHATLADNYAKILKGKVISPPEKTGVRTWRNPGEKEKNKKEKIYLATRRSAEIIAQELQTHYGGSAYVLEVHVDEENLYPDEDTGADSWINSINTAEGENSNFGRSCSYKGNINKFKLYKKFNYVLPRERVNYYFRQLDDVLKEKDDSILKEMEGEIKKRKALENKLFES